MLLYCEAERVKLECPVDCPVGFTVGCVDVVGWLGTVFPVVPWPFESVPNKFNGFS